MKKSLLLVLAAATTALAAPAAYRVVHHGDVSWTVPGNLPPGAEYHLIYEDQATHGIQALVRFPSNYATGAHSHSHDEILVVLKGKLVVETGGKTDTLSPGDYAVIPAGQSHSLKSAGWRGCEMLMTVSGPYDVLGSSR